jgi:pimeloyl-ACP methyl ester carboxylesterase
MRLHLTCLVALGITAPLKAQGVVSPGYPPPGRLVDIGGRKLHLHCSGNGSPTVIFVGGAGAYALDWALVQPRIDTIARVCSYDRAGLGWSDPGPKDETVEQTIHDLHVLLRSAGEHTPYLLVGASIGGIFIRGYQHLYPDDVAGLVFANSSHRVGKFVPGKSGLLWDLSEDDLRSAYPLPPSVTKGPVPTRAGVPFDRLSPELQAIRLWFEVRRWENWDRAKAGPQTDLSWRQEFLREFEEKCSGGVHPLGELPLVVLSDEPKPSQPDPLRSQGAPSCHRDDAGDGLDALSSNSLYIVAGSSGHEIHLYQPAVLVQALQRVVVAIRTQTLLAGVPKRP